MAGFQKDIDADAARFFELKRSLFEKQLNVTADSITKLVIFPNQKGDLIAYSVRETPVFHPELSARYPTIRSYSGISQDGTSKIRFSNSQKGLQGMVVNMTGSETHYIHKAAKDEDQYVVYARGNFGSNKKFLCETKERIRNLKLPQHTLVEDQTLRKFRIAVSTTGEYTAYHGGSVADALAAINATLTRVNAVFETDLGITLEVIANNDLIVFTDPDSDPYTNNLGSQVQNVLTSTIGEANYDVGHLFDAAPSEAQNNGNAGFIGAVCSDNRKGSAFVSVFEPEGDIFDLDFVSHELGHQFGANHTWSFDSENSGVQAEPASGTTIMGYAGIVDGNNVAPNGDDYFHYYSILQVTDYVQTIFCAETTALTNAPPQIEPIEDFVIPKSTAFVLAGNASDPDDDPLTYAWEQIDDGLVTTTTFGPDNPVGANFRSLPPTTDAERYFPRLERVVQGNLTQVNPTESSVWESVSDIQRMMNFALTVRDNALGGGQVASELVEVKVVNASGPFKVTSQTSNVVYGAGTVQQLTWDVANTDQAPINAETVDVFLSIDGGNTFPILLAEDVRNDGEAEILLTGDATDSARLMVKASNNIFFAINSSNFTIQETPVVLNFDKVDFEVCQPSDIMVPFMYETYADFTETVTFSAMVPLGLTTVFTPSTVSENNTPVEVAFSNTTALAPGVYPMTIIATSASVTKEVTLKLTVYDTDFQEVTLLSPVDLSTNTRISQLFEWEADTNNTIYDIEIATDIGFTTVIEAATTPFNTYLSSNLEAETAYYWRVKPKNGCGEGMFGPPFGFSTTPLGCRSISANGLPITISASGTPVISSSVTFAEDLPVFDVTVDLDVTHSFLGDLIVSITSPSGTRVVLTSNSCGDRNNINAIFDDGGSDFSCSGTPAISGTVLPLGELAAFKGESVLGEWILEIQDTAPSDGGSLEGFSLAICAEGVFRPDEDEDGVFDDGDDLCLGTPKGVTVDTSGCPINNFPADNFLVEIQSETCSNNNNGAVLVTATDTAIDYMVTLSGDAINETAVFNGSQEFQNLDAGHYSLCITGSAGSITYRETCFDIIVEEPAPLAVDAVLNDSQLVALNLGGGGIYDIEWNGVLTQTTDTLVFLTPKTGQNKLSVSTELPCQGTYEETFFVFDGPLLFPNPVSGQATVFITDMEGHAVFRLYASNGALLREETKEINAGSVAMDFTALPTGTYYLYVSGNGIEKTLKVLKK
ncbi:MAG: reprolysin-like metallopeptidase [Bacteroidota bacterium]